MIHASTDEAAGLCFVEMRAVDLNINRKFVISAFHQRNNPFRNNFVTRASGTRELGRLRFSINAVVAPENAPPTITTS